MNQLDIYYKFLENIRNKFRNNIKPVNPDYSSESELLKKSTIFNPITKLHKQKPTQLFAIIAIIIAIIVNRYEIYKFFIELKELILNFCK